MLRNLSKMKGANIRLTRWPLALQDFDFTITYCPGTVNNNTDDLLRQVWAVTEPSTSNISTLDDSMDLHPTTSNSDGGKGVLGQPA